MSLEFVSTGDYIREWAYLPVSQVQRGTFEYTREKLIPNMASRGILKVRHFYYVEEFIIIMAFRLEMEIAELTLTLLFCDVSYIASHFIFAGFSNSSVSNGRGLIRE